VEFKKLISTPVTMVQDVLARIGTGLPLPILRSVLSRIFNPVTFLLSNLPGPCETVSVWGNRVNDFNFLLYGKRPFVISLISYKGLIKMEISATSSFIQDQAELDDIALAIHRELKAMLSLICPV
jgi:hypothetical protein